MSFPLGPEIANAFLVYFGNNMLQSCSSDFKPHYYWQYVDDIFVLFTSPDGLHANMSFALENEKQNKKSFLDVQIIGKGKTFTASVYRKPYFC